MTLICSLLYITLRSSDISKRTRVRVRTRHSEHVLFSSQYYPKKLRYFQEDPCPDITKVIVTLICSLLYITLRSADISKRTHVRVRTRHSWTRFDRRKVRCFSELQLLFYAVFEPDAPEHDLTEEKLDVFLTTTFVLRRVRVVFIVPIHIPVRTSLTIRIILTHFHQITKFYPSQKVSHWT